MYKFAIHMYKYTICRYEKQERKINGDSKAHWEQEYFQSG